MKGRDFSFESHPADRLLLSHNSVSTVLTHFQCATDSSALLKAQNSAQPNTTMFA